VSADFLTRALDSHVQWKLKLLTAIAEGGKIDKATAGVDNACEIGKWIYGEGRQFAELDAFKELQAAHKKFHDCVCHVADLIDLGRMEEAKKDIASGAYKRASAETVDGILKLKSLGVLV
jgi:hypothetical protein